MDSKLNSRFSRHKDVLSRRLPAASTKGTGTCTASTAESSSSINTPPTPPKETTSATASVSSSRRLDIVNSRWMGSASASSKASNSSRSLSVPKQRSPTAAERSLLLTTSGKKNTNVEPVAAKDNKRSNKGNSETPNSPMAVSRKQRMSRVNVVRRSMSAPKPRGEEEKLKEEPPTKQQQQQPSSSTSRLSHRDWSRHQAKLMIPARSWSKESSNNSSGSIEEKASTTTAEDEKALTRPHHHHHHLPVKPMRFRSSQETISKTASVDSQQQQQVPNNNESKDETDIVTQMIATARHFKATAPGAEAKKNDNNSNNNKQSSSVPTASTKAEQQQQPKTKPRSEAIAAAASTIGARRFRSSTTNSPVVESPISKKSNEAKADNKNKNGNSSVDSVGSTNTASSSRLQSRMRTYKRLSPTKMRHTSTTSNDAMAVSSTVTSSSKLLNAAVKAEKPSADASSVSSVPTPSTTTTNNTPFMRVYRSPVVASSAPDVASSSDNKTVASNPPTTTKSQIGLRVYRSPVAPSASTDNHSENQSVASQQSHNSKPQIGMRPYRGGSNNTIINLASSSAGARNSTPPKMVDTHNNSNKSVSSPLPASPSVTSMSLRFSEEFAKRDQEAQVKKQEARVADSQRAKMDALRGKRNEAKRIVKGAHIVATGTPSPSSDKQASEVSSPVAVRSPVSAATAEKSQLQSQRLEARQQHRSSPPLEAKPTKSSPSTSGSPPRNRQQRGSSTSSPFEAKFSKSSPATSVTPPKNRQQHGSSTSTPLEAKATKSSPSSSVTPPKNRQENLSSASPSSPMQTTPSSQSSWEKRKSRAKELVMRRGLSATRTQDSVDSVDAGSLTGSMVGSAASPVRAADTTHCVAIQPLSPSWTEQRYRASRQQRVPATAGGTVLLPSSSHEFTQPLPSLVSNLTAESFSDALSVDTATREAPLQQETSVAKVGTTSVAADDRSISTRDRMELLRAESSGSEESAGGGGGRACTNLVSSLEEQVGEVLEETVVLVSPRRSPGRKSVSPPRRSPERKREIHKSQAGGEGNVNEQDHASLDFRPFAANAEDATAVLEPSWDSSKVLFNEYQKPADTNTAKAEDDSGINLFESDGSVSEEKKENCPAVLPVLPLQINTDHDDLDPLGWPRSPPGLMNVETKTDPFGSQESSESEMDDGENLLSGPSRSEDAGGESIGPEERSEDGGEKSVEVTPKQERITAYNTKLDDDSSRNFSDEEEKVPETDDDSDGFGEDAGDVDIGYISQDSEDEDEVELVDTQSTSFEIPEFQQPSPTAASFDPAAIVAQNEQADDAGSKEIEERETATHGSAPPEDQQMEIAENGATESEEESPDHVDETPVSNDDDSALTSKDSLESSNSIISKKSSGSGLPPSGKSSLPVPPPPPPPPPGTKKKRKKNRRKDGSQSVPLLAPPPEEKIKKWEESQAAKLAFMEKQKQGDPAIIETRNVTSSPAHTDALGCSRQGLGVVSVDSAPSGDSFLFEVSTATKEAVTPQGVAHSPVSSSFVLHDSNLAEKVDMAIVAASEKFEVTKFESQSPSLASDDRSGAFSLFSKSQDTDGTSSSACRPGFDTVDTVDSLLSTYRGKSQTHATPPELEYTTMVDDATSSTNHPNMCTVFPEESPSPFTLAVASEPKIISRILDFLGDPVAVCRIKMVDKACRNFVDQNEHQLMRDAVRLGGMSMNVRPYFWLWVTLEKGAQPPAKSSDDDSEEDIFDPLTPSSSEIAGLERKGRNGKWHHVIERDVTRAFGNLPPHKSGARLRTDSIVRALVTWGQGRNVKKGVKGSSQCPVGPCASDDSGEISLTPTDTVSDWGGVTPVGSFSGSFGETSGGDESKRKKKQDSSDSEEVVEELVLSGNALTEEMKIALQGKLSFILHALAAEHEDVGYCQGMDYVVAHLLRILQDTIRWKAARGTLPHAVKSTFNRFDVVPEKGQDLSELYAEIDRSLVVEETCFRVMSAFFTSYSLQHFYWPELRCLKTCCRVFEKLIKIKLPVLADHFEHHELNVGLFALGWFQTLFLYLPSMPSATVCHMWDIWLVERSFKIFFRVGTAILFLSQPILLNHELEGMMSYLNTFPDATLLSPDILIACANQIKVTNKMLMELEQEVKDSM